MASKEKVLELIARQLKYYELEEIAGQVTASIAGGGGSGGTTAADELSSSNAIADYVRQCQVTGASLTGAWDSLGPHLSKAQLEGHASVAVRPADRLSPSNPFFTTHKFACTTACFSANGLYVATGSEDMSLKVLDVEKMKVWSSDMPATTETKPSIRQLYDHLATVTDVAFHPNGRALASCAEDCTIKLYDLQRFGIKRSFRQLQDSHPVNSIAFHPSGDFLLTATADTTIRMFDVATLKAFLPVDKKEAHSGAIHQARFSPNGDFYATCSEDGSIRLWDGTNASHIRTIEKAHGGEPVYSVHVLKNGQLLLSMGQDGKPKLWDVPSGELLMEYKGRTGSCSVRTNAVVNWDEEYVLAAEESSHAILVWCSRTGKIVDRIHGHHAIARHLAASPTENAFISCGQDSRARFWFAPPSGGKE